MKNQSSNFRKLAKTRDSVITEGLERSKEPPQLSRWRILTPAEKQMREIDHVIEQIAMMTGDAIPIDPIPETYKHPPKESKLKRQKIVRECVDKGKTIREISDAVYDAGLLGSPATISRDLEQMGLVAKRPKGGRRKVIKN